MGDISVSAVTGGSLATTSSAAVNATTPSSTASTSTTSSTTLTSDDFLQLLVAQLKNQDPSDPMDTSAMMTQTTQLAEMEQLTTMAGDSTHQLALQQRSLAAQLVGDTVSYTSSSGSTVSGTVASVSYSSSEPTLTVGNNTSVALSSVTKVTSTAA